MMGWFNEFSDKVIDSEVKFILRPIGDAILDGLTYVADGLTAVMPEIGAGIVVVCAVGIMLTGNIPKWLGRTAVGLGGVIIWLMNA